MDKLAVIEKALSEHFAMWWDNACRGCEKSIVTDETLELAGGDRPEAWNIGMNRHLAEVALNAIEGVPTPEKAEWQPCPGTGCVGGLVTYYDRDIEAERSVTCTQCNGSGYFRAPQSEGGES